MKKILLFLLTASLVVMLCACGNSSSDGGKDSKSGETFRTVELDENSEVTCKDDFVLSNFVPYKCSAASIKILVIIHLFFYDRESNWSDDMQFGFCTRYANCQPTPYRKPSVKQVGSSIRVTSKTE